MENVVTNAHINVPHQKFMPKLLFAFQNNESNYYYNITFLDSKEEPNVRHTITDCGDNEMLLKGVRY